jgi:DNA repair protein RadC
MELGGRAADSEAARALPMRCAAQVREHLRGLVSLEQEEMHVLALDARNRLLSDFVVARGGLNVVHVSPRDVFRRLMREGAASAILAHNHPSGDPLPSADDVELTNRLRDVGALVGIPILDHIILGADGHFSFSDGQVIRLQR